MKWIKLGDESNIEDNENIYNILNIIFSFSLCLCNFDTF